MELLYIIFYTYLTGKNVKEFFFVKYLNYLFIKYLKFDYFSYSTYREMLE